MMIFPSLWLMINGWVVHSCIFDDIESEKKNKCFDLKSKPQFEFIGIYLL